MISTIQTYVRRETPSVTAFQYFPPLTEEQEAWLVQTPHAELLAESTGICYLKLYHNNRDGESSVSYVVKGEWIVEDGESEVLVFSDEQFHKLYKTTP